MTCAITVFLLVRFIESRCNYFRVSSSRYTFIILLKNTRQVSATKLYNNMYLILLLTGQ